MKNRETIALLGRPIGRGPSALENAVLRLEALALALVVRSRIRRVPLRQLLQMLEQKGPGRWPSCDDEDATETAKAAAAAVRVVGKHVFRESICLCEAITLTLLLLQKGVDAQIRIGITKGSAKYLRAHAWVERRGEILIGEESGAAFQGTFDLTFGGTLG